MIKQITKKIDVVPKTWHLSAGVQVCSSMRNGSKLRE